jgi:negative regulator of flagellin synthesis FlgM
MPPIDLPPLRPTGPVEPRSPRPATDRAQTLVKAELAIPAKAEAVAPTVEVDATLTAASPPVDYDRISEIRKAIEQGRYPVIPMRVADALIASGLLLRSGK